MKDKEARDKLAKMEAKIHNLSGRVATMQALIGFLAQGVFEDSNGARVTIAAGLAALAKTNTELFERAKKGQTAPPLDFLDGSLSVVLSVREDIKDSLP